MSILIDSIDPNLKTLVMFLSVDDDSDQLYCVQVPIKDNVKLFRSSTGGGVITYNGLELKTWRISRNNDYLDEIDSYEIEGVVDINMQNINQFVVLKDDGVMLVHEVMMAYDQIRDSFTSINSVTNIPGRIVWSLSQVSCSMSYLTRNYVSSVYMLNETLQTDTYGYIEGVTDNDMFRLAGLSFDTSAIFNEDRIILSNDEGNMVISNKVVGGYNIRYVVCISWNYGYYGMDVYILNSIGDLYLYEVEHEFEDDELPRVTLIKQDVLSIIGIVPSSYTHDMDAFVVVLDGDNRPSIINDKSFRIDSSCLPEYATCLSTDAMDTYNNKSRRIKSAHMDI